MADPDDSAMTRLRNGVRASVRNNFTAYGFSVMITATFGVAVVGLGQPEVGDVSCSSSRRSPASP